MIADPYEYMENHWIEHFQRDKFYSMWIISQ